MAKALLIVHGYSDGSGSFRALKNYFAKADHYPRGNIFMLDYSSMDDDASFRDFADKLDEEFEVKIKGKRGFKRIDVACHSTGSLIVRGWLALLAKRADARGTPFVCPVDHLLMFAPANFGSDLARMGQSFLGKINSTFFNRASKHKDALESGKKVLQGLEPASPFQWDLSHIDLFEKSYLGGGGDSICYPFVFAAGESYSGFQTRVVKARKKPGTDGTVRICGTSLNARRCKVNFSTKYVYPDWSKAKASTNIPFCVFSGFNHGSIAKDTGRFGDDGGPGDLIARALKVRNRESYKKAAEEFRKRTELNYQAMDGDNAKRFQQFFFRVTDDVGWPVDDFFIDFYVIGTNNRQHKRLTGMFDKKFESKFYTHSDDTSCRVMMVRCDELKEFAAEMKDAGARLVFDIVGKGPIRGVSYQQGKCVIWDAAEQRLNARTSFISPNTTTLVSVVLNRLEDKRFLEVAT